MTVQVTFVLPLGNLYTKWSLSVVFHSGIVARVKQTGIVVQLYKYAHIVNKKRSYGQEGGSYVRTTYGIAAERNRRLDAVAAPLWQC